MDRDSYLAFCASLEGAALDNPFEDDPITCVARHSDNRKWFALVMRLNGKDVVNLKVHPEDAFAEREAFDGIIPAYHMNKTHWITISPESDVPDELIRDLTRESYDLTRRKLPKIKKQPEF